jgi:membrane protease YdiL (CAAX protease family)
METPHQVGTSRYKMAYAFVSFLVGMALLLFVGGILQSRFGMTGLVLTELMILAVAIISTLASGLSFREVFRVRCSSGMEWLGSFLIYLSAFFGAATVSYLLSVLTPSVQETSQYINEFIISGGFILAFIGVSILPAICEEAWHRGYLLSSLASIRSIAVRVIIMGVVFGIFHFDPTRFLQTMILGFALSFMRIRTDNLLIPVVFHGLNNLTSVSLLFGLSFLTGLLPEPELQGALESSTGPLELTILIPLVIFTCSLSILFLTLGRHVLKRAGRSFAPTSAVASTVMPAPVTTPTSTPLLAVPPSTPIPSSAAPLSSYPPPSTQQQMPLTPYPQQNRKTITVIIICLAVAVLSCFACFFLPLLLTF